MSFKPLKKTILAAALALSCVFNTEAQVPSRGFAAGQTHHNAPALPGDTVCRNVDKNGVLVSIERYTNGNLNDGPNGEPGYQEFNRDGKVIVAEHYADGILGDAVGGAPAVRNFNDDGVLIHEEHYKNNERHDGKNGEPAYQDFNDSGTLILAMRYRKGVLTAILSEAEMKAYQAQKKNSSETAVTPAPAPEKPPHHCFFRRIFHRH
ncbi:MAG: hypothetical protein K8R48_01200 [Alphaproteobacteria bacterium]|nr:hypothetical protein [Alphaproteobacteria bacterium]